MPVGEKVRESLSQRAVLRLTRSPLPRWPRGSGCRVQWEIGATENTGPGISDPQNSDPGTMEGWCNPSTGNAAERQTPAWCAGCTCSVLWGTGGQRNCCTRHCGCIHQPSYGCIAARTARAEICARTRSPVGAHVGVHAPDPRVLARIPALRPRGLRWRAPGAWASARGAYLGYRRLHGQHADAGGGGSSARRWLAVGFCQALPTLPAPVCTCV